jgi:hypothetical protein
MCCGCWNDDGAPVIDNERVRAVQPLIAAVYEHSYAGGNLHIALDDNNLEDEDLEFCSKCIDGAGVMPLNGSTFTAHVRHNNEKRANPDPPDQLAAERACCDALMAMTFEERVSALGLWDGCWSLNAAARTPQEER